MSDASFRIHSDRPVGLISPRLYGHFAEHLGRCCYDGLWVGVDNRHIPHQDGFRLDVLQALQQMPVPLLRWPGGCYADHYHWRDGIGLPNQRPQRLGMSCDLQVVDDNSLGTHEFMHFCQLLAAEPYLAGNVGTGSPQELCDWVEYCNSVLDTSLTRQRAANGSPKPFNVRLWGVGNENWGCGGSFDAVSYAYEYRRYATMLRHVDPSAELVICGYDDAWNGELLRALGRHSALVDHLSIHHYWTQGGPETEFTEQQYYALLAEAQSCEAFIQRTADIIQAETGGKRPIGIALDEWGVWHPEARKWGPGEVERRPLRSNYEQAGTLRDALAAAVALEAFHRQCKVLTLANLAQIVNVLHAPVQTRAEQMWLTPTYFVFQLHQPHMGAVALTTTIEQGSTLDDGSGAVTATASTRDGNIAVTIINRHYRESSTVRILDNSLLAQAVGQLLAADSPRALNSADNPHTVGLQPLPVEAEEPGHWRLELPPHSVATIRLVVH